MTTLTTSQWLLVLTGLEVANVASQRRVLIRTKAPNVSAQYLTYALSFPCAKKSENNTSQFFRHIH